MKKIFIILSLGILMLSCNSMKPKETKKMKDLNYEMKTKTYEIKWIMPETPYEIINVQINSEFEKEKEDIMGMGDEFSAEMAKRHQTTSLLPFILRGKYEVIENDLDIYSLIYKVYEYTGGAHGMESYTIYNISKKTGKPVDLEKMLGKGYEKKIIDTINKKIAENKKLGEDDPNKIYYSTDEITTLEGSDFYFKDKSLIIVFSECEIAPYSSGKIEYEFPISEF